MSNELVFWALICLTVTAVSVFCWCFPGLVLGQSMPDLEYHRFYLLLLLLAVLVFISAFIFGTIYQLGLLGVM